MKMIRLNGFNDYKSRDANELGMLSFYFIMGLLVLFIICAIFLAFMGDKITEIFILAFVTLTGEIITGTTTLVQTIKVENDMVNNNTDSGKIRKIKGKKQGYVLFSIFFALILLVFAIFL